MKANRRFVFLLVAVLLIFSFGPATMIAQVAAAQAPYIHLHSFDLVCQSGGTLIVIQVRFDSFLPQGYY